MIRNYPQILTTKSTLPDITVWRNRSLPLLDGGTGEHSISPMPTFPLAPCADTKPCGTTTWAMTAPLLAGTVHAAVMSATALPPKNINPRIVTSTVTPPEVAKQRAVMSAVMDPPTVPPVTVDHGTSPHGNRLPWLHCEREKIGMSPSVDMLPINMTTLGNPTRERHRLPWLNPPLMNSNVMVTGLLTPKHRLKNKRR